jgi:hypothetical protein
MLELSLKKLVNEKSWSTSKPLESHANRVPEHILDEAFGRFEVTFDPIVDSLQISSSGHAN